MQIKEIEQEALKLSRKKRAILAEHILESLEPKKNFENLWLEEAKERYNLFCNGKLTTISANDAFKKAFSSLK